MSIRIGQREELRSSAQTTPFNPELVYPTSCIHQSHLKLNSATNQHMIFSYIFLAKARILLHNTDFYLFVQPRSPGGSISLTLTCVIKYQASSPVHMYVCMYKYMCVYFLQSIHLQYHHLSLFFLSFFFFFAF